MERGCAELFKERTLHFSSSIDEKLGLTVDLRKFTTFLIFVNFQSLNVFQRKRVFLIRQSL